MDRGRRVNAHRLLAALAVAAAVSACASNPSTATTGRVFEGQVTNLSTGEVVDGVVRTNRSGENVVFAGPTASGESFTGEARPVDGRMRATLVGSQGTVIEIHYQVSSSGGGTGEGVDNRGVRYGIVFTPPRPSP